MIGYEASELTLRLEQTITGKLRGLGYTAYILRIYSEGPLFVYDVPETNARLKENAEARHAQQSFAEMVSGALLDRGSQAVSCSVAATSRRDRLHFSSRIV